VALGSSGTSTRLRRLAAAALCCCAALPAAAAAQVAPATFATLNGPIGVTVAPDGSVFATYDGIGDVRLVKFNPQGQVVRQVAFGNFGSVGEVGKLALDPATGRVWDLFTTGEIRTFDPNTLDSVSLGTLRATPVDRSSVFDVSQGRRRDMSGEILPELSTFGDIALLRAGGLLDVFATGRSSSGVPYVVRARFNGDAFIGAGAVVAASISSREDNSARGVAVNAAGTVLTTLPTPDIRLDVADRPYVFSSTFPEAGAAPRLALGGRDLASRGMASDAAGNFYVTGFIGSTICGRDAAGAIIVLSPDGASARCHPFSPTPVNMQDVAAGPPAAPSVFSTLLGYPGRVLLWGRLAVPSQTAPDLGPTPADNSSCETARKRLRAAVRQMRRLAKAAKRARGTAREREARAKLRKAKRKVRAARKRKKRTCLTGAVRAW
jgi:hypothetical protein